SFSKGFNFLNGRALNILSPGGTLLLCTNSSAFSLKAFKNVIKKTLAQNNIVYEINEVMGLPKDFKTHPHYKPSKYLKAVFVTIKH
ncbi:class I SAM-dependent rRNA methyltransferase, partial [Staphylococcus epidermidis]|nr:class I SAM-dependent rRNA methyltransferase [Staphylococcus epidermidis]